MTINPEYRRGLTIDGWQKMWHFDEGCRDYPARNYAVRSTKPPADDLCVRCGSAGRIR